MEITKEFLAMVKSDIQEIDKTLALNDNQANWKLFRKLDGRYQACIRNWYAGMWGASHDGSKLYINHLESSPHDIAENLELIKAKLETYQYQVNAVQEHQDASTQVNVTTNVNVNISFDEARQKVEDMTALSQEETDEILERINELERISNEPLSKKKKWEKVKPIISFALDKGVDVAIAILSLVVQMKLGI